MPGLATLLLAAAAAAGVRGDGSCAVDIARRARATGSTACPPGAGSGGAFAVRVLGLSCAAAAGVLESGLRAGRTETRTGGFSCRHTVVTPSDYRWTCTRAGDGAAMGFRTYG